MTRLLVTVAPRRQAENRRHPFLSLMPRPGRGEGSSQDSRRKNQAVAAREGFASARIGYSDGKSTDVEVRLGTTPSLPDAWDAANGNPREGRRQDRDAPGHLTRFAGNGDHNPKIPTWNGETSGQPMAVGS